MVSLQPPVGRRFVPRGRHMLVYDLLSVAASVVGAFTLRFDARDPFGQVLLFAPVSLLPLATQPLTNVVFGLYQREWRYASVRELVSIFAAVFTASVVNAVAFLTLAALGMPGTSGLPRSFFLLEGMLSLILIGGGRFALRIAQEGLRPSTRVGDEVPTLVYGAGAAGAAMARLARQERAAAISVVGFLDDDPAKRGSRLHGIRIHGGLDQLGRAIRDTAATQLVVAMPTAPGSVIRKAVDTAHQQGLSVRIARPLDEMLGTPDRLIRIRQVSLDDLLRREQARYDRDDLARYLNGASILVTGAGGSIGSELVRQMIVLGPRRLTVVDHSEVALWSVQREFAARSGVDYGAFDVALADVRSPAAINRIMDRAEPDVVFHAAALKHVPVCESHPSEAVLTNVVGTRNVVVASGDRGVERFILISTDKAVQPVSVMGATKRLAELVTQEVSAKYAGSYAAVRFGNVLGSSGSVVPIFQDQLERGIPLTVTDPEATRYFMTIPEAVTLILEAASDASSGEIYLLDMGEPIRILDLAQDMIRLSGLSPDDVEIHITGLRPGERLHEQLLFDHESVAPTTHDRVLRTLSAGSKPRAGLAANLIDELAILAQRSDDRAVRELLASSGMLQGGGAEAVQS